MHHYLDPDLAFSCCQHLVSHQPVLPTSPSSACPSPEMQACCGQHYCLAHQCPLSHAPALLQTLCVTHEARTVGPAGGGQGHFVGLGRPLTGVLVQAELPVGAHSEGQQLGQPAVPAAVLSWHARLQGAISQLSFAIVVKPTGLNLAQLMRPSRNALNYLSSAAGQNTVLLHLRTEHSTTTAV